MQQPLIPHRAVLSLLATAILLPIVICVIFGVAALLQAMGDAVGGAVLYRIALGCGILWGIDLICLILVQSIRSLQGPDESE